MLTRFAPSPTGFLHIGNIRTALICWLYARKSGGKFMLRIDDTDRERSREEFVEAIREDLAWLGISPDMEMRQSERFPRYNVVIEKLKSIGRLYPCYETAEELDFKRKIQLGRGMPPVYDRASLKLSDAEKAKLESEGKKPHYRFLLEDKEIEWVDEIRGAIKISPTSMSDPIVIRGNGDYTYMLPSSVDDIDFSVTHILRGEDHISNTAIQIQIMQALGAKIPNFAHNSLIKNREGKLSKRTGKAGVAELRGQGVLPIALCSFLAKLGTSDNVELKENLQQLVDEFDIHKFSKAPTQYDFEDMLRLNSKALHITKFADVKASLPAQMTEEFWNSVRSNVENIETAKLWWDICTGEVKAEIAAEDIDFLKESANLLPQGEINSTTWDIWVAELKDKTSRKGKQLFMPLRKALTGLEHGPELKDLLPLLGREVILKRLNGTN
ncbi:MAG: glutamate--tRNA ligase [Rickettsiales bacterium]|nr:glutamate--tRNA ligase [Rickettsiales bacterium]